MFLFDIYMHVWHENWISKRSTTFKGIKQHRNVKIMTTSWIESLGEFINENCVGDDGIQSLSIMIWYIRLKCTLFTSTWDLELELFSSHIVDSVIFRWNFGQFFRSLSNCFVRLVFYLYHYLYFDCKIVLLI